MCLCDSQVVLVVKNPAGNAGDIRDEGSTPGLGKCPEGGHGNPLQYSCLENPMDRGAWKATVHSVAKSQTGLKWLGVHSCVCVYMHLCEDAGEEKVRGHFTLNSPWRVQFFIIPVYCGRGLSELGKALGFLFSSPLPERCEKSQLGFEASSYRLASAFRVKVLPYLSEQSPPSRFSLLISISVWSLLCSKDYAFKSNPLSLSIVLSKRTESNNLAHQYQKQKSICSFLTLCLPLAHVVPLFPTQFPTWLCCPFSVYYGHRPKMSVFLSKEPLHVGFIFPLHVSRGLHVFPWLYCLRYSWTANWRL